MSRTTAVRVHGVSSLWRPSYDNSVLPNQVRRHFSDTSKMLQGRADVSRGAAFLQSRRLVELRGPQASQFLQGLTTANIPTTSPAQPKAVYSAFLNAQGRLLQDVFIYHLSAGSTLLPIDSEKWKSIDEQRFLIEVDAGQISNLMRWLRKYRLRAKVTIREMSVDEIGVFSAWDDSSAPESMFAGTSNGNDDLVALADTRAPRFGLRILSRQRNFPAFFGEHLHLDSISSEAEKQYHIRRYHFGIPEGQIELAHETALVHDSNIDYMGGVDFRKGCYVGQELVIRTQHTGVVRKRILPCVLYTAGDDVPERIEYHDTATELVRGGSDIKSLADEGKRVRSKGKWLAGIGNIGLALCRLEDLVGLGPAGDNLEGWEPKRWTVDQPDKPEVKDAMIKAFIPAWWQERIRTIKQGEPGLSP